MRGAENVCGDVCRVVACRVGVAISPSKWQSASSMVISLLEPRNLVDSSRSLTRSRTRAPRT